MVKKRRRTLANPPFKWCCLFFIGGLPVMGQSFALSDFHVRKNCREGGVFPDFFLCHCPILLIYKYSKKSGICIVSFHFKGRRLVSNCLSRMSGLVIIHITSAILFKLSIQVYFHTNDWNIFLVGQEFVHGCSGPFGFFCRRGDSFCKKHINNFS